MWSWTSITLVCKKKKCILYESLKREFEMCKQSLYDCSRAIYFHRRIPQYNGERWFIWNNKCDVVDQNQEDIKEPILVQQNQEDHHVVPTLTSSAQSVKIKNPEDQEEETSSSFKKKIEIEQPDQTSGYPQITKTTMKLWTEIVRDWEALWQFHTSKILESHILMISCFSRKLNSYVQNLAIELGYTYSFVVYTYDSSGGYAVFFLGMIRLRFCC